MKLLGTFCRSCFFDLEMIFLMVLDGFCSGSCSGGLCILAFSVCLKLILACVATGCTPFWTARPNVPLYLFC